MFFTCQIIKMLSDSAQIRESQCELTCPVGGVSPEVPIHSLPRSAPTLAAGAPGVRSVRTQSTQGNPDPTVDALCPSAPPSSSFAHHRAPTGKLWSPSCSLRRAGRLAIMHTGNRSMARETRKLHDWTHPVGANRETSQTSPSCPSPGPARSRR